MIDPSLYLPDLVRNVYSPDENQSSASDAIIGVLKRHNQNIDDIIFLLLDCLNNICQNLDDPPDAKMIYPSLYLPDLVRNVYSPDENQSSASDAIIGVLKRHNQNIDDIIFLLLDCLKCKDDMCLMEVLKRLASENISQRRNAKDVIAEILHISLASKKPFSHSAWYDCSFSYTIFFF
ncbi:hypothetical protein P8452_66592 [Trifolium repens]|nr:hypothetical protein P8452_66592 [Trifolium repens]